jgi:transposase-like protein
MGAEKERLMSKPSFQHINASAGAAGSEGERSEPELPAAPADAAPPDPEARPRRPARRFTSDQKQRILDEIGAAPPGTVGAILRREGLYYSTLVSWRKTSKRARSASNAGPKTRDPRILEIARLQRENVRLQKKLHKAELMIDLQKKVSRILGIALPAIEDSDDEPESD